MKLGLVTSIFFMVAPSMALAQASDTADAAERSQARDERTATSFESERARLANQRIQTEVEIRAREERRRLEAAEQEKLRAQEKAQESENAIAPGAESSPTGAGSVDDMSRTLMQLRSLGELKDDGYITEEEFRRIKKKILDSQT